MFEIERIISGQTTNRLKRKMRKDSRGITVVAAVFKPFYATTQTLANNSGIADKPFASQFKLEPINHMATIDTSPWIRLESASDHSLIENDSASYSIKYLS